MITVEKLAIYQKFEGDGDRWERSASKNDQQVMTYEDWGLIEQLISNLIIIKNGLASDEFISETVKKVEDNCENDKAVGMLYNLSVNL